MLGGRDEEGEVEEEEDGYVAYRSPALAPSMATFCRSSSSASSSSEGEERLQQEEAGEGRVKMELLYVRPPIICVFSRKDTSHWYGPPGIDPRPPWVLGC